MASNSIHARSTIRFSFPQRFFLNYIQYHVFLVDASATVLQGTFEELVEYGHLQLKIDRIYICGGFNGQECMNSAEYFDPKVNQWTIIAPMRHRRSGIGVVAYHQCIYALSVHRSDDRRSSKEQRMLV